MSETLRSLIALMVTRVLNFRPTVAMLCLCLLYSGANAQTVSLVAPGAPEELQERLKAASTVFSARTLGLDTPQELLAASLADYRTLIQVLYDQGYFSPVISIRLDGREAVEINPISPPGAVQSIEMNIRTGRRFRLGRAEIGPLARGTEIPRAFQTGGPASTRLLRDAAIAGVDGWRNQGHAKAKVGAQKIVAVHSDAILNAEIELLPGPQLRFGRMIVSGNENVRTDAVRKIAGFPAGQVFDPEAVRKVAARLRRTGAFSSVSVTEAQAANPDGTLDFDATLAENLPRRLTFGAEIASRTGLDLSAVWVHRNLFGAAERLRFEARLRNIGGQDDLDGLLALRLDRPAALGPDDSMFYMAEFEKLDETHFSALRGTLGLGVRRVFSDHLTGELALAVQRTSADDAFGANREFRMLRVISNLELDRRDNALDARSGYYLKLQVDPFAGVSGTRSGVRAYADGRAYLSLSQSQKVVLAGRLQLGTVFGASLPQVSPDLLFFSGGAGTVRGQPYDSLGIPVGTDTAGGRSLLAGSFEVRGRITDRIRLVGFYDFGSVDPGGFVDASSPFHSGAGLGVRYELQGFGPLRLDLAIPVSGTTDGGLQFYLGIGQAF